MKLIVLSALLGISWVSALSADRTEAIRARIAATPRAELPFIVAQLVRHAPLADRESVKATALAAVRKKAPTALRATLDELAENRPPVTPGNEHGQRPVEVPAGPRNYGTP